MIISENINNLKNKKSFKDFIANSYLAYKKNFQNETEKKIKKINENETEKKKEDFEFNFDLREKSENLEKTEDFDIIEFSADFKQDEIFSNFSGFCQIGIFKRKNEFVKKTCSTNFSNEEEEFNF